MESEVRSSLAGDESSRRPLVMGEKLGPRCGRIVLAGVTFRNLAAFRLASLTVGFGAGG